MVSYTVVASYMMQKFDQNLKHTVHFSLLTALVPSSMLWYSLIYTLRTLVCKIVHALHEQENLRCVLVCALEVDDISIAHRQYKHQA